MEGKTCPRQRAPRVLRTFNPTRLQDDLLAAVYDRLIGGNVRSQRPQDKLEQFQLEAVSAEHGQLAKTGG
jgi:hypothetical protein